MEANGDALDARAFEQALGSVSSPIQLRAAQDFEAQFADSRYGDVHLNRISVSEHRARGGIHPSSRRLLVFAYQVAGEISIVQDGRAATARPGDLWVYSPARPFQVNFESSSEVVGVVVPVERLTAYRGRVDGLTGRSFDGADAVTRAVGTAADMFERVLHGVEPGLQSRFVGHVLDAIDTFSRHAIVDVGLLQGGQSDRLQEVLVFIDENLGSADLSPRMIAKSMHVSLRSLYGLFEDAETSVSATIRERRLERSRRDLLDATMASEPVGAIGARWGFASASHFSTAFRGSFGMTPSAYRHHQAAS